MGVSARSYLDAPLASWTRADTPNLSSEDAIARYQSKQRALRGPEGQQGVTQGGRTSVRPGTRGLAQELVGLVVDPGKEWDSARVADPWASIACPISPECFPQSRSRSNSTSGHGPLS